jgi:branched-subunit amino acid aminotransferase/4-amino-4-deoxychorismate lyase
VSEPLATRIEIDGRPGTLEQLRALTLPDFGHFTAMQVRGGAVRGLELHLARLSTANREMFGVGLDGDLIRDHIRHALGDDVADASVRVHLQGPDERVDPSVIVTVRPPGGMTGGHWSLKSVPYQRSLAHLKHLGDFGQSYYRRLVRRGGFDEALLTGPDGIISEGAITNVGFFDGDAVVWPGAPCLAGITMRLLEPALAARGLPSRCATVRLADVDTFASILVTNSRGIAPVGRIDGLAVPVDTRLMATVADAYASVPWDRI